MATTVVVLGVQPKVLALLTAISLAAASESQFNITTSPAFANYNPFMAKAFASLATLTYCASESPRGVPLGVARAVKKNCNNESGSFCKRAGFIVVPASVATVDLPDMKHPHELFAIVAGFQRTGTAASTTSVPVESGCVVAFRGSIGDPKTAPNWKRDGQTEPISPSNWTKCFKCKVHSGFWQVWSLMRSSVIEKLELAGCTAKGRSAIYVTGHSLGGATALLAMYGLQSEGFDVQLSYIFEAPHVGNAYFASSFAALFKRDVPLYHIAYKNDRVPAGSPKFLQPPFQVHYHADNGYTICYDPSDGKCGVNAYPKNQLASASKSAPNTSPHCSNPLAPYQNFCQFTGNPAFPLGQFYLGMAGRDAFNKVCQQGEKMHPPPALVTETFADSSSPPVVV